MARIHRQLRFWTFIPLRHDLMQKEVHEEAAAVAFTHAALWFLRETNVGDADCLSWSTADVFLWPVHSAVEMVWAVKEGRKIQQGWKGEMRASLGLSLSFSFFLGPSVVCNRRDGNWFPGELFCGRLSHGEIIILPLPPTWRGLCDSQAVLVLFQEALL